HTDGHIDTLARFVAPGVVAYMEPCDSDDPHRDTLKQIAETLATFTDTQGRRLQMVRVPSPGKILDPEGEVMPASYLNFYIGNRTVVVPTYGSPYDEEAVAAIASCFPTRRTLGLSAKAILLGGGAFHCITQQQPLI
ncbi:MAG: agmatine deiminase family protein, partial [Leptolyngbyaceae bacterium]|nr:agmatine deiminase family protein [Leptolyngbyaceae bacterium]